ncbi:hypothetical protein EV126DRAFT_422033 [Verticillium dahliae]|nr:hypothetical protein EV126DRAFT_422033 [Verticillium dahliae]
MQGFPPLLSPILAILAINPMDAMDAMPAMTARWDPCCGIPAWVSCSSCPTDQQSSHAALHHPNSERQRNQSTAPWRCAPERHNNADLEEGRGLPVL